MSHTRFIFGVDLDGVVADFYGAIRAFAAEWLGKRADELTTDVAYGLKEWGLEEDEYEELHRWVVTQHEFFAALNPIPGASSALRRLSQRHDVHTRIITHRLFIPHFHQIQIEQTVRWLDRHAVPYRDLCFVADKAAVGADLYMDDTPKNIESLLDRHCSVIVFTNSTNRHLDAELRADDWEEAERLVLRAQSAWKTKREAPAVTPGA